MRKWMPIGVILASTLLFLPGCSGGKPGGSAGAGVETGATGNESQDGTISKAVKDKLAADPSLKSENIEVNVNGGQVQLTGTVQSIAEKDKVESAVREAIQPFSSVNAGIDNQIQVAEPTEAAAGGNNTGAAGASGKP